MNRYTILKSVFCLGLVSATMALAPAQAMTLAPAPLAVAASVEQAGCYNCYVPPRYHRSYRYHRPRYSYHPPRRVYHAPSYHPNSYRDDLTSAIRPSA